jgi:hypothetical protein
MVVVLLKLSILTLTACPALSGTIVDVLTQVAVVPLLCKI